MNGGPSGWTLSDHIFFLSPVDLGLMLLVGQTL